MQNSLLLYGTWILSWPRQHIDQSEIHCVTWVQIHRKCDICKSGIFPFKVEFQELTEDVFWCFDGPTLFTVTSYKHLAFRNQAQEVHIKIPFLATRSSILLYHSTTMFRSELGLGFRPEYQRICDENTLQCQQSLETQRSDSFFTA